MGKFNEELVKAGVMEAGEGLHRPSKGVDQSMATGKAASSADRRRLRHLVGGFWLMNTRSAGWSD